MATIIAFTGLRKENVSEHQTATYSDQSQIKDMAEIIIFPGVRIERISADNSEVKHNIDNFSKFGCQH